MSPPRVVGVQQMKTADFLFPKISKSGNPDVETTQGSHRDEQIKKLQDTDTVDSEGRRKQLVAT